jgi:hypothetical protein
MTKMQATATPRIPQRWSYGTTITYYFQSALIRFNHEHQRAATLPECRQMYKAAKETAIKYDRRYSGLLVR